MAFLLDPRKQTDVRGFITQKLRLLDIYPQAETRLGTLPTNDKATGAGGVGDGSASTSKPSSCCQDVLSLCPAAGILVGGGWCLSALDSAESSRASLPLLLGVLFLGSWLPFPGFGLRPWLPAGLATTAQTLQPSNLCGPATTAIRPAPTAASNTSSEPLYGYLQMNISIPAMRL